MKKLLCILICILLFAGCEKTREAENEIPDFYGFNADVKTVVNDINISAKAEFKSLSLLRDKLIAMIETLPNEYQQQVELFTWEKLNRIEAVKTAFGL